MIATCFVFAIKSENEMNKLEDAPELKEAFDKKFNSYAYLRVNYAEIVPVSYTHLTLPTKRIV